MPEDKLPLPQFAAKIKAKYPQYKDVADDILVGRILEKYPEYASSVDLAPKKKETQAAASVGASIGGTASAGASASLGKSSLSSAYKEEPPTNSIQLTTGEKEQLARSLNDQQTAAVKTLPLVEKPKKNTAFPAFAEADDPLKTARSKVPWVLPQNVAPPDLQQKINTGMANGLEVQQYNRLLSANKEYRSTQAQDKNLQAAFHNEFDKLPQKDLQTYLNGLLQKRKPGADIGGMATDDAKEILHDNETALTALNIFEKNRRFADVMGGSKTVEEAALKNLSHIDPEAYKKFQSAGTATPALQGYASHLFLSDPTVQKWAAGSPAAQASYNAAYVKMFTDYKSYGRKMIGEAMAAERQNKGYDSSLLTVLDDSSDPNKITGNDKLFQRLVAEGKLPKQAEGLYKEMRGKLDYYVPTTDLTSAMLRGSTKGMKNILGFATDWTKSGKQATIDKVETDYSTPHVDGKRFQGFINDTGEFTGEMIPLMLLTKNIAALGVGSKAASTIATGIYFEHPNRERAIDLYPNDKAAQNLYTLAATGIDMIIGRLYDRSKPLDALTGSAKGEIKAAVTSLRSGTITQAAYQDAVEGAVDKFLTKAKDYGVHVATENTKQAAHMAGFTAAHNLLDAAIGKDDLHPGDVAESFKHAFLSGGILSAMAGAKGSEKVAARNLTDLVENASAVKDRIDRDVNMSDAEKSDALQNLNTAFDIKTEMEGDASFTALTEKSKTRFLLHEVNQRLLEEKAKSTTSPTLKAKLKADAERSREINLKLLASRGIEPFHTEDAEGKEAAPDKEKQRAAQTSVAERLVTDHEQSAANDTPKPEENADPLRQETAAEELQPAATPSPVERSEPDAGQSVKRTVGESYTTRNGLYTVSYENGKRMVRDGAGNTPSERTQKTYLREHAQTLNYGEGKTVEQKIAAGEVTPPEFSHPSEAVKFTAEHSENPAEVAETYLATPKENAGLSAKEDAIANYGIGKVKESSYREFGDGNNITNGKARTYFKKDGRSLDVVAKEIAGHTGLEVEPSDIVDFMDRFQKGEGDALRLRETDGHTALKTRFEELTGVPLTESMAIEAAKQKYSADEIAAAEKALGEELQTEPLPEDDLLRWMEETAEQEDGTENEPIFNEESTNNDPRTNIGEADFGEQIPETTIPETEPGAETNLSEEQRGQDASPSLAGAERPGLEAGGERVKKTLVTRRAYEGTFREGVKKELERIGLYREVESHAEAKTKAKEFIDSIGEEAALDAVRNHDVPGGSAAYIWDAALQSIERQISEGATPEAAAELMRRQAELLDEAGSQQLSFGRFNSAWGTIMQQSDLGYNSTPKQKEWVAQFGSEPTAELLEVWKQRDAQLAELKTKITEAEKRAEEAEAKAALAEIQAAIARKAAAGKTKTYTQKAKTVADSFRKLKSKPPVFLDADGNEIKTFASGVTWNDLVEIGAKAIELTGKVADGLKAVAAKLGAEDWFKAMDERNRAAVLKQVEDAFTKLDGETTTGRIKIPNKMIREAVEAGAHDIDTLTKVIKEGIKETFPDATDREVRDAITEYGKVVNPNMETIAAEIRRLKRVGRTVSALEDVAAKKRPLRSGLQRDKLDAEERDLQKQLREAMKDLPVDEETQSRQLKTAIDAAKQRIRNRIEDLERQIATGEKPERNEKATPTDDELKTLTEERDRLQEIHDTVFAETPLTEGERRINSLQSQLDKLLAKDFGSSGEKPTYSATEQAQIKDLQEQIFEAKKEAGLVKSKRTAEEIRIDSINMVIEETERRIKEQDFDKKKTGSPLQTDAIKARQSALSETRDALKKLKEETGFAAKQRLQSAKKRVQGRIEDLERRIKTGDFSKKVSKPVVADTELTRLNAEKLRVQEEYDKEFHKAEILNRTKAQKTKDMIWEAWSLARSLQATGEASFVLMQGGAMTTSYLLHRPGVVASAFKNMFRALRSEKASENWLHKIKSQEWYPVAKEAKLAITEPNAKLLAREEAFFSGWTNFLWDRLGSPLKLKNKEAHQKWVNANPFKALERGAGAYLDTLRVERFLDGKQILDIKKAAGEEITAQDYKDVADVANTLTGRASLGPLEQQSQLLTRVFFSPRLWASAIKTATPYGLIHFGKMTPTARKMAIADMARFVGLTTGLVMTAAARLNSDDDDKTGVEFDPRSSDFMKIRLGDTRIDPWGGRIQQIIFSTRITLGLISLPLGNHPLNAYKNSSGELHPLGVKYKSPTLAATGIDMATNKLSPTAAMLAEFAFSELKTIDGKTERVDKFGKPYSLGDKALERLYPIYAGTVKDLLKDDPKALDGMLILYSFFGGGVNVYDNTKKKTSGGSLTSSLGGSLGGNLK